ncbi:18581_t:CDS:2 [Funneliformis geosporum]|nr:18581_t:CDS:2 [Funneliformis geosporum]
MPECLYVKQVEMKKHLSPLKDKKKDIELVIDLISTRSLSLSGVIEQVLANVEKKNITAGNSDSSFFLRELTESVISSK